MNYIPEEAEVDYTASVLLIRDGEILLMDHEKLGQWILQSSAPQMTC